MTDNLTVVAEAFGLPLRDAVVEFRWMGTLAHAFIEFDADELTRRQQLGYGAHTDRRVIGRVADLPLGVWIPRAEVDLRDVDPAVHALVQVDGSKIRRVSRPPLAVSLVVVSGGSWRDTLDRASRFAPVAPRAALIRHRPVDRDAATLKATWLEAGLAVGSSSGVDVVAHPGDRVGDDAMFHWWFTETVYAAHLELSARQRRHPSAA
jgi:hypothetical protein